MLFRQSKKALPKALSVIRLFCLFLLSTFTFATTPSEKFAVQLSQFEVMALQREFFARDGTKISYTVLSAFQDPGVPSFGSLVISTGKGETNLRYMNLAKKLLSLGHGPILILEHRGQGRSQRQLPSKPNTIYVKEFNQYVDDLIEFMDGPVRKEIEGKGKYHKPKILAHSMGGVVVDLALLKRPDLTDRVAYVSPMFKIQVFNRLLGLPLEKPIKILAELLCLAGCGTVDLPIPSSVPFVKKVQAHIRLEQSRELERKLKVSVERTALRWIKEAIGAMETVRRRASEHWTRTLIISGSHDTIVGNSAMVEYACSARNCSIVELKGGHALHQDEDSIIEQLANELDHFFQTGEVLSPRAQACLNVFN